MRASTNVGFGSVPAFVTDREFFRLGGCYGVASSFMHLIETAPGWPLKDFLEQLNNEWKIELRDRVVRGGHQFQTKVCFGSAAAGHSD